MSMKDSDIIKLGLDKAILKAGGSQAALARAAGVTNNAVSKWVKKGAIPVERVPDLAKALEMDRSEMRPDFWPPQVQVMRVA